MDFFGAGEIKYLSGFSGAKDCHSSIKLLRRRRSIYIHTFSAPEMPEKYLNTPYKE